MISRITILVGFSIVVAALITSTFYPQGLGSLGEKVFVAGLFSGMIVAISGPAATLFDSPWVRTSAIAGFAVMACSFWVGFFIDDEVRASMATFAWLFGGLIIGLMG